MFLFKLWPWFEANRKQVIIGASIIAALVVVLSFWSWQREQKQIYAGESLTQLSLTIPPNATVSQIGDLYLKVASDHPDTLAGERALMQGAATLFAAGRYDDALTQFQKYLEVHPDGFLTTTARLGIASSLEAQGKTDAAVAAYQKVIGGSSDAMAVIVAKFALARISEQQGKLTDAMNYYEDVGRAASPNSSIASEARMRVSEINMKLPAAQPAVINP